MMELITEHIVTWTGAEIPQTNGGRGRGRGGNGQSPHGIKKLRELILELAVRGKLVEQDPNDEPASVLLERIAKEKARLIKEGKIKKQKPLPEITQEEKPYELPEGWVWVRFGEISHQITDGTHHTPTYIPNGVPFLSVKDMSSGFLDFSKTRFIPEEQHKELIKRCNPQKGDLLLTKVGTTGIPVLVETDVAFSVFVSVALIKFPTEQVSGNYLSLLVKSPLVKSQSEEGTEGIGNKNLVLRKIEAFSLALPPLAEQHRIVAKVDELMALCDMLEQQQTDSNETHQALVETLLATLTTSTDQAEFAQAWQRIADHFDTLFTTEESIDQLKQTILQLAVMGKLVEQDPSDEPASVLLEKIAKEKAKLIKEGKIKKQNPLPKISDDEKPFELPGGWEWARLDDLALRSEAGWSPKCEATPREDNNWGVLKVSAVTWGQYKPGENKALPSSLDPRPEYEVQPNDFLISRANTADLVARAVVVPKDAPPRLMMSDKIIRFVFPPSGNTEFINLANRSSLSREYYSRVAGGTSSSMKNVSRDQIRMLLIALPPSAEQHRIVTKVNELMALCDILKARLHEAQTTQIQLADAIVEQAVAA